MCSLNGFTSFENVEVKEKNTVSHCATTSSSRPSPRNRICNVRCTTRVMQHNFLIHNLKWQKNEQCTTVSLILLGSH
jgi:hypothetical protein